MESNWSSEENGYILEKEISEVKQREFERGVTLIGPHRTIFNFL